LASLPGGTFRGKKLRNHDEVLIEQLQNPEMAKAYLEVALEEYEQDGEERVFSGSTAECGGGTVWDDPLCGKNGFESSKPLSGFVFRGKP
jgi:hypothetical protein